MQIVLAVHPDRHQTERIAALLRKRRIAELVQAASAGDGLLELGERVPDLILTAPLLSPFDEDVLAEYLREMGRAAAHVQTLRIPVMSATDESGGGIFSFAKKKRAEPGTGGCTPEHFVDEIVEYLHRASAERSAAASDATANRAAPNSVTTEQVTSASGDPHASDAAVDAYSYGFEPAASAPETQTEYTPIYQPEDASSSAFPIYRPDGESAPPTSTAVWQMPAVQEDARSQPESTPLLSRVDFIDLEPPVVHEMGEGSRATSESAFPIYQPYQVEATAVDPMHNSFGETTVRSIYEPAPAPDVASSSNELATSLIAADDGHSSLVLEPPSAAVAKQPVAVRSTESSDRLAESLTRAARHVGGAGNTEPVSHAEVASTSASSWLATPALSETPSRAAETAASRRSVSEAPTNAYVTPIREEPVRLSVEESAATLAPTATVASATQDQASKTSSESDVHRTPTFEAARTPSFEAALAAIRKAWGTSRRASTTPDDSCVSLNIGRTITQLDPAPMTPTTAQGLKVISDSSPGPSQASVEARPSIKPAREADLRHEVAPVETPSLLTPADRQAIGGVTYRAETDAAAWKPSQVRDNPDATANVDETPLTAPEVPEIKATPVGEQSAGKQPRKRDAHRKKSDKREATAPHAAKPAHGTRAEHDEWGLFDPDQCGFAALVNKLDEVTDEKDQKDQKGEKPKTKVRLISWA